MIAVRPPILDAHVHFWSPRRMQYPWLAAVPALEQEFLPEHLDALSEGAIDAAVFVEANCDPADSRAEVQFAEDLAVNEPRIVGTVAFVDLLDERSRVERLAVLADRRSVVGVRHNIQGQPPGHCLNYAFVDGVSDVGALGLTFDLCITADQLGNATTLVTNCPDTRFVLDHCGKPSIRTDAFATWASGIDRLAALPNVACKVSGLFTEARPDQRTADALRPYVEHVRTCFGADRLLYGSDWPVVTLAGGEPRWRATIEELTAEWPTADRTLFYADNAMRVYHANR